MRHLLHQEEWRIIDQSAMGAHFPALQSFGTDDTLCASTGTGKAPATVRTWVHDHTIVLGIQDTKLPYLADGIQFLNDQGYQAIVRNSGGLAVVLDEGVLNISLILPEIEKGIDINRGYETMWDLIKNMFADFQVEIEAKEIVGSYCPGSFDLSISGKKFAGISQRRLKRGVAVQIYLCVSGSGSKRAKLVKEFYERAIKGEQTKFTFPKIVPEVMASLSELLDCPFTIADVLLRLFTELKRNCHFLYNGQLNEFELSLFPGYYQRVLERNEQYIK